MLTNLLILCLVLVSSVMAGVPFTTKRNRTLGVGFIRQQLSDVTFQESRTRLAYDKLLGNNKNEEDFSDRSVPQYINDWVLGYYKKVPEPPEPKRVKPIIPGDINDELLGDKKQACLLETLKKESQHAENQVVLFLALLKTFTRETVFDFYEFEKQGMQLETRLQGIYQTIDRLSPCNTELLFMHGYAKYMFKSMAKSIEPLRYYSMLEEPSDVLLYSIIDLNILLLSLYSHRGAPDPEIFNFAEKVTLYLNYLNSWVDEFVSIKDVSFGKHVIFKSELNKADAALQPLINFLPS